jgi:hypothetical protein
MKHTIWLLGIAACAGLLSGCVERRYVINTVPQGATVLRNGKYIGVTPVDDYYIYYGEYDFTIIKEGFETLQVKQKIPTPWYEYFPLDFVSENLNPFPIEDRREFTYTLQPRRLINTKDLVDEAQNLRNRGRSIGDAPLPPLPVPPGPPAPPPAAAPPSGLPAQSSPPATQPAPGASS